jgi:hypothetical protein
MFKNNGSVASSTMSGFYDKGGMIMAQHHSSSFNMRQSQTFVQFFYILILILGHNYLWTESKHII